MFRLPMRLLVWSLYAAIPCHGFVPIGARGSMRRTLPRMTTEADELAEIPLFAPEAATQAPFPFPSAELLGERMYRYTFDTPSSIRMLRAVESSGTLFGHCVCSTDGDGPVGGQTAGQKRQRRDSHQAASKGGALPDEDEDLGSTMKQVAQQLPVPLPLTLTRRRPM